MSGAGRKPKPTNLKKQQGTFRKDRVRNEPKGELTKKGPSYWIKDPKAKNAWKTLEKILGPIGVLTDMDKIALEMLVLTCSQWREAVEKSSVSYSTTENGYPMPELEMVSIFP